MTEKVPDGSKSISTPLISVVLGSYNRCSFLKLTVQSIREELLRLNVASEVIVVDGGSTDGALEYLWRQKDIITILQHNRGVWNGKYLSRRSWGYFMNLGFKIAQGKYVCMLSDDCLVVPGAILNGYNYFESELAKWRNIGAMAFYWRDVGRNNKYYVYRVFENYLYVNHGLYLKNALEYVGYAQENTYQFYNGDMDLCMKMWNAGYEIIASTTSFIEHYPHANIKVRNSNTSQQAKDLSVFFNKWWPVFAGNAQPSLGYKRESIIFHDVQNTAKVFKSYRLFDVNAKLVTCCQYVFLLVQKSTLALRGIIPKWLKKTAKRVLFWRRRQL